MTCIAAIQNPETGEIAIAADGYTCGQDYLSNRTSRKIAIHDSGGIVMAVTGSVGYTNAAHELMRRTLSEGIGISDIVEEYEKLLVARGFLRVRDDSLRRETFDYRAVIVLGGKIYDIDPASQWCEIGPGFPATRGSGASEAMGACLALSEVLGLDDPCKIVRMAVEAACKCVLSCGGKIMVWSSTRGETNV